MNPSTFVALCIVFLVIVFTVWHFARKEDVASKKRWAEWEKTASPEARELAAKAGYPVRRPFSVRIKLVPGQKILKW